MTPIHNPAPGSPEERYNTAQMSIRSQIERCNGILKNRFRCLLKHRVLHYTPERASTIINACVVLHNMCISNNIEMLFEGNDIEIHDADQLGLINLMNDDNMRADPPAANANLAAGQAHRRHIIDRYF